MHDRLAAGMVAQMGAPTVAAWGGDRMIEVICRRCGLPYVPDHSSYVRGDWQTCPPCRNDPADSPRPAPRFQERTGPNNAPSSDDERKDAAA